MIEEWNESNAKVNEVRQANFLVSVTQVGGSIQANCSSFQYGNNTMRVTYRKLEVVLDR